MKPVALLSLALLALVLAGCVGPPPAPEPADRPAFPPPPTAARAIFEQTLRGPGDLKSGQTQSQLVSLLVGDDKAGAAGDGLTRPVALAVSHGRVFVANALDGSVSVFDTAQRRFYRVGDGGTVRPRAPLGLSTDAVGNLYVADGGSNAILQFDPQGNYLRTVAGPQWFSHLTNVAADPDGARIYAIDGGDAEQRIRVFAAADGRHLFDIGTHGYGPGEFNAPYDIAVGTNGRLNVVDSGNYRVQIFDRDGRYLKSFGSAGKRPGQFMRPRAIAADAEGNLYVVDGLSACVQVFDGEGNLQYVIGSRAEDGKSGHFVLPTGIGIEGDRVYVADQWYRKLEVFRLIRAPSRSATTNSNPITENGR